MIKILFIHNRLVCGGAEQALFDLVSLMDKNKFDITVLVQYDGGEWEEKFKKAGIRVVTVWGCQKQSRRLWIKYRNWLKRQRIQRAMKRDGEGLVQVCLNEAFDLVVAFNGSTLPRMCFVGGAKTVKYIHGDVGTNPEFRRSILSILDSIRRFERIICVSEEAKVSFKRITGIQKGVVRHYNPLNSENVRTLSLEDAPIPTDMPYICAVGRLAPEKGFERLIRIHKRLIGEGLLHRLVIVGDGPERSRLIQVIAEEKLEETVLLAGYQLNPYPYIKNSRFLVCSSYTEGLPVIAMEALSLGIPIVSSVPSVGEAFGDETCGLITESDDECLEIGIHRMLTDGVFYQTAKKGAERRSTFFDGKRMVKEIEEDFISLVDSK